MTVWRFLDRSMQGTELTSYHLEARIAAWHCTKEEPTRKWPSILQLYNQLLDINYSPSVALHRTFALYKADGWQAALAEAEKLQLEGNHFYYLLLGELHRHHDCALALQHWRKAFALAKTQTERQLIQQKISTLEPSA